MKDKWRLVEPKEKYNDNDFIIDKILKIRGIKNKEDFLNPSEKHLNDPFLLSNMKKAVDKITYAIKNNLKIGIYADVDADGVTSAVIMYKYLKEFDVEPVILYHQRKDSHGVIVENVPKDLDLLIIVDSSTNSVNECKAISKDMDIIILDHHQATRKNKYAIVVNPQINKYPNKHLSGAGVVYQTCRAIDSEMVTFYADNYIDICAVGLIGDVMNITSLETRYLIQEGLYKIHNDCYPQLKEILKSLKKDNKPNATTIAFYVVPFINAIIRLGKIQDIIEIFISDDLKTVKKLIKSCGEMNDKRKSIQGDIVEQISDDIDLSHKIIIVDITKMYENSNLNGLIANNIAQKYQKPTLVVNLEEETGIYKGSGRGYGNDFSFNELLKQTRLFELVEGHDNSFGVEFKKDNFDKILEDVDKILEDFKQEYVIEADMKISVDDITWDVLDDLEKLSFITGEGFKDPIFIIEDIPIEEVKVMKEVHLKLSSEDLECVKFNVSPEEIEKSHEAIFMDVIGSLSINSWYNFGTKETVVTKQIMVKDMELC